MSKKKILISSLFIITYLLSANILNAQSIGLEIGTAGVENFDFPVLEYGASFSIPFNDAVFCELSYNRWHGDDSNYTMTLKDDPAFIESSYFGNIGINLLIYYNLKKTSKFNASIGTGFGHYQYRDAYYFENIHTIEIYSKYMSAISIAGKFNFKIASRYFMYGKIIISNPLTNLGPNWALFNVGLEYSFKD